MARNQDGGSNGCIGNWTAITRLSGGFAHFKAPTCSFQGLSWPTKMPILPENIVKVSELVYKVQKTKVGMLYKNSEHWKKKRVTDDCVAITFHVNLQSSLLWLFLRCHPYPLKVVWWQCSNDSAQATGSGEIELHSSLKGQAVKRPSERAASQRQTCKRAPAPRTVPHGGHIRTNAAHAQYL